MWDYDFLEGDFEWNQNQRLILDLELSVKPETTLWIGEKSVLWICLIFRCDVCFSAVIPFFTPHYSLLSSSLSPSSDGVTPSPYYRTLTLFYRNPHCALSRFHPSDGSDPRTRRARTCSRTVSSVWRRPAGCPSRPPTARMVHTR